MRAVLVLAVFAQAEPTAEVKGTAVVPAKLESFKGRTLEVSLYRYDPRAADQPAELVDRVEVKAFDHAKGADTIKEFALGKKEKRDDGRGYYVTLFVLDGKARTHIGDCAHAPGFARVLSGGGPSEVKATFREVKR